MVNPWSHISKRCGLLLMSTSMWLVSAHAAEMLETPAAEGSRFGSITTTKDDQVVLSWVTQVEDRTRLMTATWDGDWSSAMEIASGNNWFVNWADFPAIVTSPSGWFAHWLEKNGASTYAYGVRLATSTDNGKTWVVGDWLHRDRSATEHGFVDYAVSDQAEVMASWLDGGQTVDGGPMTLRAAQLSEHGARAETLLDDRVCDCCQTAVGWTREGPLVVYRNRTRSEVRDIFYTRRVAGAWSTPAAVAADNWNITGCPVNGPAVATDGEKVAVVWFTAADNKPRVRAAFSDDSGATFQAPVEIASDTSGRVDAQWTPSGNLALTYLRNSGNQSELKLTVLDNKGEVKQDFTVATLDAGRGTGFPRLTATSNALYVVWTAVRDGQTTLKLAKVRT